MKRIVNARPFRPPIINGVRFVDRGSTSVSEEVSDEVAAQFTRVNGFSEWSGSSDEEREVEDLLAKQRVIVPASVSWSPELEAELSRRVTERVAAINAAHDDLVAKYAAASERCEFLSNELEKVKRELAEAHLAGYVSSGKRKRGRPSGVVVDEAKAWS